MQIKVQPRSSRIAVEGIVENVLKIKLTAPPADGEANTQLIKLLSKEYGIPKTSMRIIKGQTSRNKVIEITD